MAGASDKPSTSLAAVMAEVRALGTRLDDTREDMGGRLDEIRADAREARDEAKALRSDLEARNLPVAVAELRKDMESGFAGARGDLVNAQDHIRRDITTRFADIEKRLAALERLKDRIEGAGNLGSWVVRHAPWLLAVVFAAAAALGWKDKLP